MDNKHQFGCSAAPVSKRLRLFSASGIVSPQSAFSLIEILVVIAIMALLAGLTVGLVGITGEKKRILAAKTRIEKLNMLVELYKSKKGFYPPDNPNNFSDPTNTSLFYELVGAEVSGTTFKTPYASIDKGDLQVGCGVSIVANSTGASVSDAENRSAFQPFLSQVSSDETNLITVGSAKIVVFVAPEGPNGRIVNPIYYRIGSETNGAHNSKGVDLWAEVKTRKGGKIVGNWKD